MPYSSFTLAKVKKEFGLTTVEAGRFLPQIDPIAPSSRLQAVLQCIAEMVAVQLFNQANQINIPTIYGAVSNGTQWRFLKLEGATVAIDLMDYALPPVDQILGFLVWMVREG